MNYKNKYIILYPIGILMILSLLNMINSEMINTLYDGHFIKQLCWFIIGFFILFFCTKINNIKLFDYSFILYVISIILLILVLFLGKEINGAKAWIDLGVFSLQPSELTKITLALLLTKITINKTNNFKYIILLFIYTLIPCVLVFLEPDTGAIIFYLLIALVCFLSAKLNKKYYIIIFTLLLIILGSLVSLYIFNEDLFINIFGTSLFYRIDRLIYFSDNYQINNALILIGSSPLLKNGIGELSLYVPEAPTDFIYAFNIGNYGLLAGIIVTICYLFISLILISYIKKANNKLFAKVFATIFIFQISFNILMNLGLLPIMGIPLLFLSYGGTSLIITFLFIGIIINDM